MLFWTVPTLISGLLAVQTVPPCPPAAPSGAGVAVNPAEAFLETLEREDAALRTLTADVQYDRVFEIQGDRQVRVGKVSFEDAGAKAEGARTRRFAVRFSNLVVGDRVDAEPYELIFDGRWLVERRPAQKQIVKTRLAREGEDFDPLRIGTTPMPLPIGQKKADILARYTVELLPAEDGVVGNVTGDTEALKKFVKDAVQLKLTVRPELAKSEEVREARLWYRVEGGVHTPRLARAVSRAGDVSLVQLINVKVNQGVGNEAFDTAVPETGWDVQVRE